MAYEPNNIQNEMAYFYAVVKNMDLNDNIKRAKVCEHEAPFEEGICDYFSDVSIMDKQLSETSLLSWIEFIENEKLHTAIKSLKTEDQILISQVVNEGKTWQELASMYEIDQSNVRKRFNKIIRILKNLLFKKIIFMFDKFCAKMQPQKHSLISRRVNLHNLSF